MSVLLAVALGGCSAGEGAPAGMPPSIDEAVLARTFEGLGAGPFDTTGRPTDDGHRVQDVLALQGALLRFHAERRAYPAGLDELSPEFVPSVPRDPDANRSYAYQRAGDGADYTLTATLSNGRVFAGGAARCALTGSEAERPSSSGSSSRSCW